MSLLKYRLEEQPLGPEMVVQGPGRDPRLPRQVLHRRAGEAALTKQAAARLY